MYMYRERGLIERIFGEGLSEGSSNQATFLYVCMYMYI